MPTYHVENFGCRATQADGATIERQFEGRALTRAVAAAEADFVILNTCTVTNAADQDARAAIRRVQRQNPGAKIIVTGRNALPRRLRRCPGLQQSLAIRTSICSRGSFSTTLRMRHQALRRMQFAIMVSFLYQFFLAADRQATDLTRSTSPTFLRTRSYLPHRCLRAPESIGKIRGRGQT
jgi:Uncharacterized protein family UPF0004